MRRDYEKFRSAGLDVAAVTMGTPQQAAGFQRRMELPFACFADPHQMAYKAFGVPRGSLAQIAGPAIWGRSLKSLIRWGAGRPVGDPFQLHGAFVVDRDGVIRFIHRPADSADLPNHDDMITAVAAGGGAA